MGWMEEGCGTTEDGCPESGERGREGASGFTTKRDTLGRERKGAGGGRRRGKVKSHPGPTGWDNAVPTAGEEDASWEGGPLKASSGGCAGPDVDTVVAWGTGSPAPEGDIVSFLGIHHRVPTFSQDARKVPGLADEGKALGEVRGSDDQGSTRVEHATGGGGWHSGGPDHCG